MQIKRVVISCFLLFTYSLGFAHNLIPHCEASNIEHQENSHHHHEHHQHDSDDKDIDHEDIVHNGHLDAGFYDYFLCFLSDTEHPIHDCNLNHYLPANTYDKVDTELSKAKFIAVLITVFSTTEQDEALPKTRSEFASIYLSPPIGDSPHRGPPSFSC
jgi:hypothetical protein